jgi:hypothetical protein
MGGHQLMTTRLKTIEFATPSLNTTVVDATVTNLNQITLYIPESSPTFRSVFVEIAWRDVITATGGTVNEHRCGLQLGAAGYNTITETDDITQTGENIGGVLGPFDYTAYFTTNWTGTSMTCDIQVYFDQNSGTTLGVTNVSAKIYVTYEYDDTAATQIKTVRIPFESRVGTLPTTAANFGTTQIPALDTFLPEAGVVIRDYFFVIEGNETNQNNTNWTLNCDIAGASAYAFATTVAALQSDVYMRWIYKPGTIPDTSIAHNFRIWAATLGRANHVTVTLYVTYEFTLAGTTRMVNSILLPIEIASPLGYTTSAEASRFTRDIFCVEPGTITLRQSAFRINYINNVSSNQSWRAGSQSFLTYTSVTNMACGMYSLQQRIDSGGSQGAGITLSRGRNTIVIDGYAASNANELTNINGYIILNYESDVPSEGIGAAAKTIFQNALSWNAALLEFVRINNGSFQIIESDYWLTSVGFCLTHWVATTSQAITFDVECLSGEGKGAGYYDIYVDAYQADSERGCSQVWMRGRDVFKRFPTDADPERLDIETSRDFRLFTTTASGNGIFVTVTYHTMTWEISGNIVNANGSLTTDLLLYRASDNELMQTQTLSAGTSTYTFTVYDDTEEYYVVARQNDSLVGRSGNGVAS